MIMGHSSVNVPAGGALRRSQRKGRAAASWAPVDQYAGLKIGDRVVVKGTTPRREGRIVVLGDLGVVLMQDNTGRRWQKLASEFRKIE